MRISSLSTLLGLAALASAAQVLPRNYDTHDTYVLHLERDASPDEVARSLGLSFDGAFGELPDHFLFSSKRTEHDIVKRELAERRRRKRSLTERDPLDVIRFSQKQKVRAPWQKRMPPVRFGPSVAPRQDETPVAAVVAKQSQVAMALGIVDPIFNEQWHLLNILQPGHDVNVTDVWLQGVTGKNATVAIVDDGLDMYSDDLKDNYYAQGSYDFNDKTEEPKPRLSDDRHGTRCAGEVSAVKNNVCGLGVAYDSKIAGLRILSKLISDADEAIAMNYDYQHNQIYSCSWGPPDDGRSMDAPGILIRRAMLNAVQNGRGGLGSIYVFASGNGASQDDNCNFDGYTNSIYSITVGAVDRKGGHPYYSEKCSAGLVVTYSSGAGDGIHTTDVGTNTCYNMHGGTSAAAPLAAGIFALALQVRPDLSWRDMQYIAMYSAVQVNYDDGEWQMTASGKNFSHTFGYGKVDSYGLVELAKTWKNVKPQAWYYSPWIHVNQEIPQGNVGIHVAFDVTADMLAEANLERLEHVTVTMNVLHTRRGDLSVDLVSPTGAVSHISVPRRLDLSDAGYEDWTFMSVVHWGETGIGAWTLIVKDTQVNEYNGTFVDWHLKLWGESKDASKAKVLPMPTEEDDNDHAFIPTTTIAATTATVSPIHEETNTAPMTTATDHPDRPSKVQPTTSGDVVAPEATASTTATAAPEQTSSSWLPGFLPTFGVASSTTLAWIYGAVGLIAVFCAGLGVYLYMARRRRLRNNPRDGYEFDQLLNADEAEGLNGGGEKFAGALGGRRAGQRRTRGGELYDAFAGGSDDEDEDDEYRDRSNERIAGDEVASGRRNNEKRRAGGDDDDEEEHHVVGDDDDEEEDGAEARPLRGGR